MFQFFEDSMEDVHMVGSKIKRLELISFLPEKGIDFMRTSVFNLLLGLAIVCSIANSVAASPKNEGPILLIHGLAANDGKWNDFCARTFQEFGWETCDATINFCLNYDGDVASNNLDVEIIRSDEPVRVSSADIAVYFESPGRPYDIYRLSFDNNASFPENAGAVYATAVMESPSSNHVFYNMPTSDLNRLHVGLKCEYLAFIDQVSGTSDLPCVVTGIEAASDVPIPAGYNVAILPTSDAPLPASIVGPSILLNSDVWSNHEAIMKQGRAVGEAIRIILEETGADTVTLIAHSMGGLAARAYLQWGRGHGAVDSFWVDPNDPEFGHKVLQLVSIGTPHNGSNLAANDLSEWKWGNHPRSNAARDLAYNYAGVDFDDPVSNLAGNTGILLYGGNEVALQEDFVDGLVSSEFECADIDCDGNSNNTMVLGINDINNPLLSNPLIPLPDNVAYSYVFGRDIISIPGSGIGNGDGCVSTSRAFLLNGPGKEVVAKHDIDYIIDFSCYLLDAFPVIIEAMDHDSPLPLDVQHSRLGSFARLGSGSGDIDLFSFETTTYMDFTSWFSWMPTDYIVSVTGASSGLQVGPVAFTANSDEIISTVLPPDTYTLMLQSDEGYTEAPTDSPCTEVDGLWNDQYLVEIDLSQVGNFIISGRILDDGGLPITDVIIQGIPEYAATDASGVFSISVPAGWDGTVIPEKPNYSFAPSDKSPTEPLVADWTNVDFVGYYSAPRFEVINLHQIPDGDADPLPKPGESVVIVGNVQYLDGTPLNGGIVELTLGDCTTADNFTGNSFSTAPCEAPETSMIAQLRIIDTTRDAYVDTTFFVLVDELSSLEIDTPRPGDRWAVGTRQSICWSFSDASCGVDIEISYDSGATWNSHSSGATGTRCVEDYVSGPSSSSAYVRVRCQSDTSVYDIVGPIEIYEVDDSISIGHTISGSLSGINVDQGMNFSPDGSYLAFRKSENSGQVTIYDTRTHQHLVTPFPSANGSFALAFSPNSRYLATVSNNQLYAWDLVSGSWQTNAASTGDREGEAIAWIDDWSIALIGDTEGGEDGAAIFDTDGSLLATLNGTNLQSLTSDGVYVYGGDSDGNIYRWSRSGGNYLQKVPACMNDVFALDVSPNGDRLVAVGRGLSDCNRPNVSIFTLPTLSLVRQGWVINDTSEIFDACYDPNDPSRIVLVERDGQVTVINELLQVVMQAERASPTLSATDVSWSTNGVVAVNAQSQIRLYPVMDVVDPIITIGSLTGGGVDGCIADATGVLATSYKLDNGDWQTMVLTPGGCFNIPFSGLPAGVHTIGLDAADLAGNHAYLTQEFSISCEPLTAPVLISPPDGSLEITAPLLLTWTAVPDVAAYEYVCYPEGQTPVTKTVNSASALMSALEDGQVYRWQVRGVDACGGTGPWSEEWVFSTDTNILGYGQSADFVLNTNTIGSGESGLFFLSGVDESNIPNVTSLGTPYPNPFNPMVSIPFTVGKAGLIEIGIYDVRGRCVCHLVAKSLDSGKYLQRWSGQQDNGTTASAGVYMVRIKGGDSGNIRKIVLVK